MALPKTKIESIDESAAAQGLVLVVEDDPSTNAALVRILRESGFAVVDVPNGKEALAMLGRQTFDLVVTDVQMPDLDGVGLLRSIRHEDPNTSVLLISGAPDLDMAIQGMRFGASDFLVKPFEPGTFSSRVGKAVQATKRKRSEQASLLRAQTESSRNGPTSRPPDSWTGVELANRYLVGKEIGSGGMSTVYEATREDLGGMPVALKLLRQTLSSDADVLARFHPLHPALHP